MRLKLWVADITYIRLHREWVFLAVVLDAFSRKVVGWELDRTLAARLPIAALEKAIAERKPPSGVVHHSDCGVQYASSVYVAVLQKHGMILSMSDRRTRTTRELREFHEDAEAGGNLRERVSRSRPSPRQHRGIHRQLLQPCPAAFGARLQATGGVRAGRQRLEDFARRDPEFFQT